MSEAAEIIHQHSRSFSLAARLLPQRVRGDVMALYAWCRTADDIVDGATDITVAEKRLVRLMEDVLAIAHVLEIPPGKPVQDEPVQDAAAHDDATKWIAPLIQRRQIDAQHALELLEGMEMDCRGFRAEEMSELRRYCYHVAGTVGLMMSQLMGVRDPAARQPAIALGIAMQLTNIARDVREDALRGRSYLPGIACPLACDEAQVQQAVERILAVAEEQYELASSGIHFIPKSCRMAVRVALAVYREIGREIARQAYPVLERRVVITRGRLLWVATLATLSPAHRNVPNSRGRVSMSQLPESRQSRIAQARWAVCLGLSLTSVMAAVLFLLVFINPKEESYGYLPLLYSGLSLIAAVVMYQLALRFESKAATPIE